MRHSLFAAAIIAMPLFGACTTVDMTRMGTERATPVASSFEPNIVEKATSRLFALFSSKGWSTLESRKKMQSAASILLDGLDDKALTDVPSTYAATSAEQFADDVREATYHIGQTVKAAEVFLTMSAPADDIREELVELEQALLAARQAEDVFEAAASGFGSPTAMAKLVTSTDRLRDVTDEFGRRVRRAQSRNVAMRAGTIL